MRIIVFFSHKTNSDSHGLYHAMAPHFAAFDAHLSCNEFPQGVNVIVAMERFEVDAMVFYATHESVESRHCKSELARAKELGIPIFTVTLHDVKIPDEARHRILVKLPLPSPAERESQLKELARSVAARGALHRLIRSYRRSTSTSEEREECLKAICELDGLAIAEFRSQLIDLYEPEIDHTCLFWLATALGQSRHRDACPPLRKWLKKARHPLPVLGIKEALELLGCDGEAEPPIDRSRSGPRSANKYGRN